MKHWSVFVVTAGKALVSVDPSPRDGSSQTRPPGFIPTEDGVIMYVCVVRSPWTPESDLHPRTLRVRFSYEDSRLSFVDFDVGP